MPKSRPSQAETARRHTMPFHPELMRSLRYLAADLDCSVPEALHRLLCERFDRTDLIQQVSESVMSA